MKLSIDIPEKLLEQIVRASAAATHEDAVLRALEEFVRIETASPLADADTDDWDIFADEDPDEDLPPRPG